MARGKLNPLALFASGIAGYAVWVNRLHVLDPEWIGSALVAAFVAIAWLKDKSIGGWLSAASAFLFVCLLFSGGQTSAASRVITSGACAGILSVMLVRFVAKLKNRP